MRGLTLRQKMAVFCPVSTGASSAWSPQGTIVVVGRSHDLGFVWRLRSNTRRKREILPLEALHCA